MDKLINGDIKINNTYPCIINITYEEINSEDVILYLQEIIKKLVKDKPSLISLSESVPKIDDDIIIFEVISKMEEETVIAEEENIRKILARFGFLDYYITTNINEEKQKNVEEELKNVQAPMEYKVSLKEYKPGEVILGKSIQKEMVKISSINNVGRNITIEGYIETVDYLERDNINIITLSINDNEKSILAKVFKKDKEEYLPLKNVCNKIYLIYIKIMDLNISL